jgi:hypothetical protein
LVSRQRQPAAGLHNAWPSNKSGRLRADPIPNTVCQDDAESKYTPKNCKPFACAVVFALSAPMAETLAPLFTGRCGDDQRDPPTGQVALLDQIDARNHRRMPTLIAQAPTGFGKTIVAGIAAASSGHATSRHFHGTGLKPRRPDGRKAIRGGRPPTLVSSIFSPDDESGAAIQVATPQSLQRREIPDADEILSTKLHIWFSRLYPKLLSDPRLPTCPS